MRRDEIQALIDAAVDELVERLKAELRAEHLTCNDGRSPAEKTESLLRNYAVLRHMDYTDSRMEKAEIALRAISHDPYYDVIRMMYFEGYTREYTAELIGCSPATITRHKHRLINQMATLIFPND